MKEKSQLKATMQRTASRESLKPHTTVKRVLNEMATRKALLEMLPRLMKKDWAAQVDDGTKMPLFCHQTKLRTKASACAMSAIKRLWMRVRKELDSGRAATSFPARASESRDGSFLMLEWVGRRFAPMDSSEM